VQKRPKNTGETTTPNLISKDQRAGVAAVLRLFLSGQLHNILA